MFGYVKFDLENLCWMKIMDIRVNWVLNGWVFVIVVFEGSIYYYYGVNMKKDLKVGVLV